ncbi:hypothetical protein Avbf_10979 [Armadillidium vulgare]|nr:hypothetical protein Avbf_10979 [Armadillidium vulgare]
MKQFSLKEKASEHFKLVLEKEGTRYYGPTRLLEYAMKNISIVIDEENDVSIVTMQFDNLGSYFIANTYAPTFLMMIIGYLTFYFPIDAFDERIMVALTALLVQASFFSEVSLTIVN